LLKRQNPYPLERPAPLPLRLDLRPLPLFLKRQHRPLRLRRMSRQYPQRNAPKMRFR